MHSKVFKKSEFDFSQIKFEPGDFILTHGTSFLNIMIQVFTMSRWNHIALVTDSKGTIIELITSGIKKNNISKYKKEEVFYVKTDFNDQDRKEIMDYAYHMFRKHHKYGFLQIACITFKIMTKSRLIIKLDGTQICSEFVANALARGGAIWDTDASLVSPQDVYKKIVLHSHHAHEPASSELLLNT